MAFRNLTKRITLFTLSAGLALSLASCGGDPEYSTGDEFLGLKRENEYGRCLTDSTGAFITDSVRFAEDQFIVKRHDGTILRYELDSSSDLNHKNDYSIPFRSLTVTDIEGNVTKYSFRDLQNLDLYKNVGRDLGHYLERIYEHNREDVIETIW